jgi:hypothetical protein
MGLDMYLKGHKFFFSQQREKDEEGYEIESQDVTLGYWRKHANLHGYIVQKYADGDDNCRDIELGLEEIKHLLEVVKDPTQMPATTGFFFGSSANDDEQIKEDTEILSRAVAFLTAPTVMGGDKSVWRSVIYRASW